MSESASASQGTLFGETSVADVVVLNDRCELRRDGERYVVFVARLPISYFDVGDRHARVFAMHNLVELGWASQQQVARAFDCSTRTLRRYQRDVEDGGLAQIGRPGYPKGRPRSPASDRLVAKLKASGLSNRAIALRMGINEKAVRKRLRRLGWMTPPPPEQLPLPLPAAADTPAPGADPNLSASTAGPVEDAASAASHAADPNLSASTAGSVEDATSAAVRAADPNLSASAAPAEQEEPAPWSVDKDAGDRRWDRLLAAFGLLEDAAPMFRNGSAVPGAGVLLAVPALLDTGVLDAARRVYGSIGPAFYGLRTTFVALLLLALLRIKRPEGVKERSPAELGRLLGLDRAPEVKTLRRKLTRLAALAGAADLGRLLAQQRVAQHGHAMGFLYVDGHVRVYHGQRRIPKTHVTRMRLSMPATTDYWVNDMRGEPVFVVTAEANAQLVRTLPQLLGEQVRPLIGQRRVTVVFDRGGWSPQMFARLIADGFDVLTYRKGKSRRVPRRCFAEHVGTFDGREVRYQLADQCVAIAYGKPPHRKRLALRQVTRLQDAHQTQILTSRRDLSAVEVAYRMFERWRQENFFKYLRDEYALDALVDYRVEQDDPTREVPNPAWAKADAELRKARAELRRCAQLYGATTLVSAERSPQDSSVQRLRRRLASIARPVWAALERVRKLDRRRARIPRRVPVAEVAEGEVVKLATERKLLTNLIKMVAYQAESDMVRALAPYYARIEEEGRTLVQSALSSRADIEVTDTELRVTLAPFSSPHRSRAVSALCADLNRKATVFPGTRLRLRYAVAEPAGAWA